MRVSHGLRGRCFRGCMCRVIGRRAMEEGRVNFEGWGWMDVMELGMCEAE